MKRPQLACCNFLPDVRELKEFALENGFNGIDWTLTAATLPQNPDQAHDLAQSLSVLDPMEVRYHCFFERSDIGDADRVKAETAMATFRGAVGVVSELRGRYLTIHVGLGRDSTDGLLWDRTLNGLGDLARHAHAAGIRLCLENLWWGWTSRPRLFEKLIRKSGCWATLDIGHAHVSPAVTSEVYEVADFVGPHPGRFLNAHIYHEEREEGGHVPPATVADVGDRLSLLRNLPSCDWWVLELREEAAILETLAVVKAFLDEDRLRGQSDPTALAYGQSLYPA